MSGCLLFFPFKNPTQPTNRNPSVLPDRCVCLPVHALSIITRYFEHPEIDAAYGATPDGSFAQYYFGDDMIAAPVVVPSTNNTVPTSFEPGAATTTVWLPPGAWVEESTSVTHTGAAGTGSLLTKAYDISETPVFVRAGAVVPTIRLSAGDSIGVAARQCVAWRAGVVWRGVGWVAWRRMGGGCGGRVGGRCAELS
jgi:hypothetical protein